MNQDTQPLLAVRDLKTYFKLDEGVVKAVDGVSFDVRPGQVVGVVGESGCGKSVTIKSVLRIVPPPGAVVGGKILYWPQKQVTYQATDSSGAHKRIIGMKIDW